MKKLLLLLLLLPCAALAQPIGIVNNATPIVGGSTGQCVTKGSNGLVSLASCVGSAVTTWSGGTTGLTPSTATGGAVTLAGTLSGANGGTGVANTGKTITLGGNVAFTGAFNSTFAASGSFTYTLPTTANKLAAATGTLVPGNIAVINATADGIVDSGSTPVLTSQPLTLSANGALSAPAFSLTGTAITGGTATTTKPLALIEPSGTTSTAWNTNGTMFAVNAAWSVGTGGNLFDFKSNNTSQVLYNNTNYQLLAVNVGGVFYYQMRWTGMVLGSTVPFGWAGTADATGAYSALMGWRAANNISLGGSDYATPPAQTLSTVGSRPGTDSNVGGGSLTVSSGKGTGTGTISTITFQSPVAAASGTGTQTLTTGLRVSNGAAVTTGYAIAALPATGNTVGARAHVTDALNAGACVFQTAVTVNGGSTFCPVTWNGSAWVGG